MHQAQKRFAVVLDQRQSEAFHVMEVAVERGWRYPAELGHLTQAQRVEAPAGRKFGGRSIHESLPGLGFLLFPRNFQSCVLCAKSANL